MTSAAERWGLRPSDWDGDDDSWALYQESLWFRSLGDVDAINADFDSRVSDPPPSIGVRSDGRALFYAGEVNNLYGGHSSGKSWIMLYTVKQAIEAGVNVIYLDFEDRARKAVYRLRLMGASAADVSRHLVHLHPKGRCTDAEREMMKQMVKAHAVGLVVVDTVGVALGREDKDSNKDSDVASWLDALPNAIASWGPAVVLVDHIAVSKDDMKKPGGSGRKMQSISGSSFSVQGVSAFGKGKVGVSILTCQKDRNGEWAIGDRAAIFQLDASGDDEWHIPATLSAPPEEADAATICAGHLDALNAPLEITQRAACALLQEHDLKPRGAAVVQAARTLRKGRTL